MRIKHKHILFLSIISIVLISLSLSAEAALTSKYESQATAAEGSAAEKPVAPVTSKAVAPAPAKPTAAAKAAPAAAVKTEPVDLPQNVNASPSGQATVIERNDLKAKQLELIKKEHLVYRKAFMDAEMGLRYFYKTPYDAKYRGAKAPTQDELKAMRFELSLLMKDLGSSAKRYSSNIRMAKMAMLDMDEEERSVFAIMLGQIIGTPAYALDAGSLSGVEAGLNSVANATANVGLSTEADYATAEANAAQAGEIAASAVSLATTVVLSGAAIVGGAALTMGAVTTGAAVVGGAVMVGGIVGGGLDTVDGVIGFIDALTSQTHDTKTLKKIKTTVNIINVTSGAQKGEMLKVVIDGIDGTKDIWIPKIFEETENKDCPGKDGVNKVKNAKKNATSDGNGGGGGGG
ncbi:MAG TPA: hypothetical protein DCM41_03705 [Synergistaceae bacterium]|nr:hypothetical protein [Synergistaceae bacterium]